MLKVVTETLNMYKPFLADQCLSIEDRAKCTSFANDVHMLCDVQYS